jgi:hypothetical protein
MTDKELKRLSRAELLELLLVQTREVERLRGELMEVRRQLQDRQVRIAEAGDLAQAMIAVNGVMEAAQAAAAQYLENVAAMEAETKEKCEQMLRAAVQETRRLRRESENDQ